MAVSTLQAKAHELIKQLDPEQLAAVVHLLQVMTEEEELTDEDRQRVREGRDWLAKHGGRGIPMPEVLADFDLKMEDFPLSRDKSQ